MYFKYLPFILITPQLPKLGINWIDLDTLSLGELKQLQADVAAAIKNFETRSRAEALAELKALAASKGFSLEELTGTGKGKAKRGSAPVKFIDPRLYQKTPGRAVDVSHAGWLRRSAAASHWRTLQSETDARPDLYQNASALCWHSTVVQTFKLSSINNTAP